MLTNRVCFSLFLFTGPSHTPLPSAPPFPFQNERPATRYLRCSFPLSLCHHSQTSDRPSSAPARFSSTESAAARQEDSHQQQASQPLSQSCCRGGIARLCDPRPASHPTISNSSSSRGGEGSFGRRIIRPPRVRQREDVYLAASGWLHTSTKAQDHLYIVFVCSCAQKGQGVRCRYPIMTAESPLCRSCRYAHLYIIGLLLSFFFPFLFFNGSLVIRSSAPHFPSTWSSSSSSLPLPRPSLCRLTYSRGCGCCCCCYTAIPLMSYPWPDRRKQKRQKRLFLNTNPPSGRKPARIPSEMYTAPRYCMDSKVCQVCMMLFSGPVLFSVQMLSQHEFPRVMASAPDGANRPLVTWAPPPPFPGDLHTCNQGPRRPLLHFNKSKADGALSPAHVAAARTHTHASLTFSSLLPAWP